jgi:hypothetical protein
MTDHRPWREIAGEPMRWHAIRTGAGLYSTVGRCVLCGARGLNIFTNSRAECPNPSGLTRTEAMALAMESKREPRC